MSSKPLQAPERAIDRGAAGRRIVSAIGCFPIHEDDSIAGWTVCENRTAEARRAFVCARPFSPPFHAHQPLTR